jgi:hypothetical protein
MLIRHHINFMIRPRAKTATLVEGIGFSHPILRDGAYKRRHRAFAGLLTTAALVVSLAIAVVAVSFGIARAGASANGPCVRTEVSCVQ